MIHNAQALQMMVNADSATPDTVNEILGDIQTDGVLAAKIIERHRAMLRSRELQAGPIDLRTVVTESLALLAHDIREAADRDDRQSAFESLRHQR